MNGKINKIVKEYGLYEIDPNSYQAKKGINVRTILNDSLDSITYNQSIEALYDIGLLKVYFLRVALLRRIEESTFSKQEIEKAYDDYCQACYELKSLRNNIPVNIEIF